MAYLAFPQPSQDVYIASHPLISSDHPTVQVEGNLMPTSHKTDQEKHWSDLTKFYTENEETISRSLALNVDAIGKDDKTSEAELAMDTFMDTANVILDGLVALGNVHPVLGIVIFAFHGVITLDLARRDNNRKVIAVKVQMQNMMCALFQLRKLKHIHVDESERERDKARLQRLVKTVAEEITACGSDLNFYLDRKFVSKLINSKTYERRFADHVATFAQRRSELQNTIAAYIAAGVDAANLAIGEVGRKVTVMDDKLNSILSMFRRLDRPREREVIEFLDQNGGAKECVAKDELLTKLLTKSGDLTTSGPRTAPNTVEQAMLLQFRKTLNAELSENLEDVLTKNISRFEKLLNVQNNNLTRISDQIEDHGYALQDSHVKLDKLVNTSILILEEGKLIKKAIAPNSAVKLKDPELQQIWERMGLKRSVKAKTFVLQLRDHLLTDRSTAGTPYLPVSLGIGEPETLHLDSDSVPASQLKPEADSDNWVLNYIDVAHLQPIIESMDEDGSGFISVKEANRFALSRPKGWSLLRWMAYWAAGWHINISTYRNKIYSILLEMHNQLPSVHVANRAYVDRYLDHYVLNNVEALLRTIKPIPDDIRKDLKLLELAESMATLQEQRLKANLTEMSFSIASPPDAILVAGSGRVETWILPLLYILLSRHLAIIKLARSHVLNERELVSQAVSLESIFMVFNERQAQLEAIFRQMYRDVEAQFTSFSYGMYLAVFKDTRYIPSENTLLWFSNTVPLPEEEVSDTSILSDGLGPHLECEELVLTDALPPACYTSNTIEGFWTGLWTRLDKEGAIYHGMIDCKIDPVVDNNIIGTGQTTFSFIRIDGKIMADKLDSETEDNLAFTMHLSDAKIVCNGRHDLERDRIVGSWVEEDGDDEGINGTFSLTRTPSEVFRYRILLQAGHLPELNIAQKRWVFAIKAVLRQTQDRMNSSKLGQERLAERRRWIEISSRWELNARLLYTRGFVTDEDKGDFSILKSQIPPANSRFYESTALYFCERLVYSVGNASCDACDQSVTHTRFQCISCMEENLSNQLDFCAPCIDTRVLVRDRHYLHHISHSLLRTIHLMHECERPITIPQARSLSERVKASFRIMEAKSATGDNHQGGNRTIKWLDSKTGKNADTDIVVSSRPSVVDLICACCDQELSLPCWACAKCARDTLICVDCDSQHKSVLNREGFTNLHRHDHPLLRIHDSLEVKLKSTNMGTQLKEISDTLNSLEGKVNIQMDEIRAEMKKVDETVPRENAPLELNPTTEAQDLERRLLNLESKLDERLSDLETKVDTQFELLRTMMEELLRREKSK